MKTKQPTCPQCARPIDWHNAPERPFCSPRCRMIDLGAWFNEDYKVSNPDEHPPLTSTKPSPSDDAH